MKPFYYFILGIYLPFAVLFSFDLNDIIDFFYTFNKDAELRNMLHSVVYYLDKDLLIQIRFINLIILVSITILLLNISINEKRKKK